ncbi:MAG: YHS domain-containing protein [Fimbriiglobus sp.]
MRRQWLISFCVLTFAFVVPVFAEDKKPDPVAKAALQKVGEFIGEWKANGKTKITGKETLWKETLQFGWKFKDGESWIALDIVDGKFNKSGELKYDTTKKLYKLKLVDKEKKEANFDGTIVKGNLVFTSKDTDSGDITKMTLYTVADGARMVLKTEVQAKGKGLFNELYSLAGNKEGESFAGGGSKKPECIVTGGAGTMAVSYMGKTYYVCCSGCREEFDANPKKYVDAFEKNKK